METTETAKNNDEMQMFLSEKLKESRKDTCRNIGIPLMVWGALIIVTALVIGHLWEHAGGPIWNVLWFGMAIAGFIIQRFVIKHYNLNRAKGFIPHLIGAAWLAFCFFVLVITIILSIVATTGSSMAGNNEVYFFPLTGIIALLMGFTETFIGLVLKKNFIIYTGAFVALSGFILDFYINDSYQVLILAFIALVGMVIPGFWLNHISKNK